jgi:nucleoside-triphosphatase
MGRCVLITGPPGCGKTTLVKKLAQRLQRLRPAGFFTEEIRRGGVRTGFALRSFDGREGLLAGVGIPARRRVGRYGVDVEGFERFLAGLDLNRQEAGLVIIDEIGKMECFSPRFQEAVRGLLSSARPLVATVALHGGGLIEEVKRRPEAKIHALTVENRDRLLESILAEIEPPSA